MPEDLWEETWSAKRAAREKEAEAERARSAFHELVRQLNVSGASLRQIASRMELSHQRVHQIVDGVACGFCDRRRAECERMVAGPGVFICDACIALGLHALAEGWGASDERTRLEMRSDDQRCCFCRKRPHRVGPMATRGPMRICGHCLALANSELDRAITPTLGKRSDRRASSVGRRSLLPRAEQALAAAVGLAREMGHGEVADLHLLFGLMAIEEGVAASALTRLGLTTSKLRDAVLARAPVGPASMEGSVGMSPDLKRIIASASAYPAGRASQKVGTENLLLALAEQSETVRRILGDLGVDPDLLGPTIEDVLAE